MPLNVLSTIEHTLDMPCTFLFHFPTFTDQLINHGIDIFIRMISTSDKQILPKG